MKREGYLIEEIVVQDNLEQSFDVVLRGTYRKQTREGKWLIRHRESFLAELKKQIIAGTLVVNHFHPKIVHEGNKWRNIQVFPMSERIAVNAVMTVVDRHIRKQFIRTTSASIKGRGMHELKEYIAKDIQSDPEGMRYLYKFDIKKFYETVEQDFIIYCVHRLFKDKRLITILTGFIRLLPQGMSMGLRASQGLCNLLLSVFLDHYLKDRYGIKHFYRYCDDGVVGHDSKLYLWEVRGIVHERIEHIGQTVKPNERVFPLKDGLDFLGYVIYPDYSLLRKRVKQQFARKLKKVKSRKRREALAGSLWGMAKHCQAWHLLETLLYPSEFNKIKRKIKKKKMQDFGNVVVNRKTIDGKKNFRGQKISGRELDHKPFIIYDYEKGIVPRREKEDYDRRVQEASARGIDISLVEKPKTRYVVNIIYQNQLRKLWTGDRDMWDDLDSAAEQKCLPAFCSMEVDYTGDYPKFSLVSGASLGFTPPTDKELRELVKRLKLR